MRILRIVVADVSLAWDLLAGAFIRRSGSRTSATMGDHMMLVVTHCEMTWLRRVVSEGVRLVGVVWSYRDELRDLGRGGTAIRCRYRLGVTQMVGGDLPLWFV